MRHELQTCFDFNQSRFFVKIRQIETNNYIIKILSHNILNI
jgi:hypothetical protein